MTDSEQNPISRNSRFQPWHTYPPSISPYTGIPSSAHDSTEGLPTLDGEPEKRGFWYVKSETQRGMQSRHLTMIAMGATIGTGIFLTTGIAVSTGGPGNALLSYVVLGIFVYATMIILGEMSAMYPVSGAFSTFATRFVSPGLGFALGWNYWLQWSLSIPSELTASAMILGFWTHRLHPWQWAIIITVPVFAFQLTNVRAYGEAEYWFASIKVVMIIFFIIVGLIYDWGGIAGHPGPGLSNFQNGQAFIGGFSAFATNLVYALYSYGGVELIAVAAGEASKPYKSIPRATKATFFRIVLFYILTMLTIGLCINHADKNLLNTTSYNEALNATSPVTIVFLHAGFGAATHVVNAVLLTTVLSVTNSCYYASSRMLLALARSGQAPLIFGVVNKRGVPVPALLVELAFSSLTFLTTIWGQSVVFVWLIKTIGISALITWTCIGVISLRFRGAYKAQGLSLFDLPYQQPLYPLLPITVIVIGTMMFIVVGYESVRHQPFDPRNVLATYIIIAFCLILFGGFVLYERFYEGKKTHFISKYEADLASDAVWKPGEGDKIRAQDHQDSHKKSSSMRSALWRVLVSDRHTHLPES